MCPQTSYSVNIPAVSYPGQIADLSNHDILSASATLAAMQYGTLGVTDESNTLGFDQLAVKAPALAADVTTVGAQLGVVVADVARAQNPAFPNPMYPQYASVPLMRKGRIYVAAETAMLDGSNPFVRFAANGLLLPGNFRNDADTGKAIQMPVGQAIVRGTTTGAGFAVIELDLV